MKRKFLSLLLLLAFMPMMATTISYNECSWDSESYTVDVTQKSREMTSVPASSSDWVGLGNGWYYVQGSVSYKTLNILGDDVNLVLCDGALLRCTSGVRLEGANHKLTIYSQSTGSSQGKLVATQNDYDAAGIGCADNEEDGDNIIGMGTLVVHGGDISATGSKYAAAIGGGKNRGIQGSVTIYGGKVKALKGDISQSIGAGIGGGWRGDQGGNITIYGGEVTAQGKGAGDDGGAGIGGGGGGSNEGGEGGTIRIYGGTVKATSQYVSGGAAIGGGSEHSFEEITISGGMVTAECEKKTVDGTTFFCRGAGIGSGYECHQHGGIIEISGGIVMVKAMEGAGIGGGYMGNGGQIKILGGEVIATSVKGAGIGGGYKGNGGNVIISGGTVTAYSSQYGAGIGGGYKGDGGSVTVSGGYVIAVGGSIEINWFKDHLPEFSAWKNNTTKYAAALDLLSWIIVGAIESGTYYGAGIGGGDKGKGGTLTITGGTVNAKGGNADAPGIGAGRKGDDQGSLTMGNDMMVFTSNTDKYVNYRTTDRQEKAHSQYNVYISDKYIPLSPYGSYTSDLAALNGQTKSVILTWRDFYCGGQYNTLCVPFSISDLSYTPLEGAHIYTVKSSKIENKILTLELQEEAHRIDAGVPYVVKWDKPEYYYRDPSQYDIETIVFDDVTIDDKAMTSKALANGTFSGAYDDTDHSVMDSARVVFNAKSYGTPAYVGYHTGAFYCNFKGTGSSKFGWEKGNFEQTLFSLDGALYKGDDEKYITHTWDAATGTLEEFVCICPEVVRIREDKRNEWYALNDNRWYLVNYSQAYRKAIEVHNNAYLILGYDNELILSGGLKVEYGKNLHIFTAKGTTPGKLTVTQSYDYTAAIGSSGNHSFGTVSIHGGIISATGTDDSAGIGPGTGYDDSMGGIPYNDPNRGDLYIYGGDITARGGKNAAGIGCSYASSKLDVHIYGGTVKAYGGEDAAGIGGSYIGYYECRRGHTTIYGGTVEATAGPGCVGRDAKKGSAIGAGRGDSDKDHGLTIAKSQVNLKVKAGDSAENTELFTTYVREPACHWRNYAKIEQCNHDDDGALSYTIIDDINHMEICKYCGYDAHQPHLYNPTTHKCACGREEDKQPETWTVSIYCAEGAYYATYNKEPYIFKVVKGEKFTIPEYENPYGLIFMQWIYNPATAPTSYEMKDSEFIPNNVFVTGYEFTPDGDVSLYAQYRYNYTAKWTWNADGPMADVSAKVEAEFANGQKTGEMETSISYDYFDADGDNPAFIRCYANVACQRAEGVTYNFSDILDRNAISTLTLSNNEDNNDKISKNNYALVNEVTLEGRTLYRNGTWNTLVLPFDLQISGSVFDTPGLDLRRLETSQYFPVTNTVRMQFSEPQTEILAGVPYLIRWTSTSGGDLTEPTFSNVIINRDRSNMSTNNVNFIGSYAPVVLAGDDRTLRYVGGDNKLYWPTSDVTLKSCRAYFRLKETGDNSQSILVDLGTITGVRKIHNSECIMQNVTYDLQGRMIIEGRLPQGINIINGKKVIK
ncbi:MAG: hypothetical protein J6W24_03535 [Prevotella sp.]|nr:hypothetical protein [Prevotella sp.]